MDSAESIHFFKDLNKFTQNPKQKNRAIIFTSGLALLFFLGVAIIFPFRDKINNILYPKSSSHAATNPPIVVTNGTLSGSTYIVNTPNLNLTLQAP